MFALIDCNNFYASCERLFRPEFNSRPVIVLSNNDGCVIARSNEAKSLGIKMGAVFYMIEDFIKEHRIAVFSSNYTLYDDMSARVMTTPIQSLAIKFHEALRPISVIRIFTVLLSIKNH